MGIAALHTSGIPANAAVQNFTLARLGLYFDGFFTCEVELKIKNVQVIKSDGTFSTLSNTDLLIPQLCLPTSVESVYELSAQIQLLPNPATDQVLLESEGLKIQELEVFDVMGRQVPVPLSWDVNPTLKVNHLPEGVYLVRLQTDQGEVTKRLVVQR